MVGLSPIAPIGRRPVRFTERIPRAGIESGPGSFEASKVQETIYA
jgi:hypothetical protein